MIIRHSGSLGDVIWSLAAVRMLARDHPIDLVLVYGVQEQRSEAHPLGSVRMSKEWAEKLVPLLEVQDYIRSVQVIDQAKWQEGYASQPHVDLDSFRTAGIDFHEGPTQRWWLWCHDLHADLTRPTIRVLPKEEVADRWVLNRTLRNQNRLLNWFLLSTLPCTFLGLPEEYDALRRILPDLEYYPVQDFLEAAQLIAGVKGFIGNQSFLFALAEALKVPRLLEVPPRFANVYPLGGTCYEARTNPAWALALEALTGRPLASSRTSDRPLTRRTPHVLFHAPDGSACTLYRAAQPAHFLSQLLKGKVNVSLSPTIPFDLDADVVVLQRVVRGSMLPAVRRWKKEGRLIVWDTDDLFTALPPTNPAAKDVTSEVKEWLAEIMDLADHITCTTPFLAFQLGHPAKTTVLPNLIDPNLYPPVKQEQRPFVRILWAGSDSHEGDLALLGPVYHALHEQYGERIQWVFAGYFPTWACAYQRHPGEPVARLIPRAKDIGFVQPVPMVRYPSALCELAPDIAVCPLADNLFNRSKSCVKVLEMSLASAAVVASLLEPYNRLNTEAMFRGIHTADWICLLRELIGEYSITRRQMNEDMLRCVHNDHSWWSERAWRPWVKFYEGLTS